MTEAHVPPVHPMPKWIARLLLGGAEGRSSREEFLRLFRYGVVGGINTFLAYLVFAGSLRLGFHFVIATLISSLFGMTMGFVLHGRFVFQNPGHGRFGRYALVVAILYVANVGIQAVARHALNSYLAGAVASLITIPASFLLNRALVFQAAESGRAVDTMAFEGE